MGYLSGSFRIFQYNEIKRQILGIKIIKLRRKSKKELQGRYMMDQHSYSYW